MGRLSIRWKLTLWYGSVLALVLTVFSIVVYLVMRHQQLERIDKGLGEEIADVLYEVKRAADQENLLVWLNRRFARHEGFDFQITRPSGERFFVNERLAAGSLPIPDSVPTEDRPHFQSQPNGSAGRWRIVSVTANGPDGPLTVQVGRSLASFEHESHELLYTFLLTGPLTLLAVISGGYFLARRTLSPVEQMRRAADEITADRLDHRIDIANPNDELGALARTLNRMIERLERSFKEMQRFTADAAHELRTPLAVIRNEAEVALRASRTKEEYAGVLENLLEETNRLSTMADQLLFLCRQDAGLNQGKREQVDVDKVLQEVVANMRLVADAKGLDVTLSSGGRSVVLGDEGQLRRLFYNLLDNAIKYTEAGGKVTVSLTATNNQCTITVQDTGIGIAPEHLDRIFERFYRVDPSRSGDLGVGLGLSICQSIVRSLGGGICLESRASRGTSVQVVLPLRS